MVTLRLAMAALPSALLSQAGTAPITLVLVRFALLAAETRLSLARNSVMMETPMTMMAAHLSANLRRASPATRMPLLDTPSARKYAVTTSTSATISAMMATLSLVTVALLSAPLNLAGTVSHKLDQRLSVLLAAVTR